MIIREANLEDNDQLLELGAQTPMQTKLCINVERKPNYFTLASLQGENAKVFVAEEEGKIVGAVGCAFRDLILLGKRRKFVYIGGIKVSREKQKGLTGFRLIKTLYEYLLTTEAEFAIVFVVSGNEAMQAILEGRVNIPRFYNFTKLKIQYCFPVKLPLSPKDLIIRPAQPEDEKQIFSLWKTFYQKFELHPADLAQKWQALFNEPNFSINNFIITEKDSQIVAGISIWDQTQFKQTIVVSYGKWLSSLTLPFQKLQLLPYPGKPVQELSVRHLFYLPESYQAARVLIKYVLNWARGKYQFVRIGTESYYPENLFAFIPRIPITIHGYIAPREASTENLAIIKKLQKSPVWEDLTLH